LAYRRMEFHSLSERLDLKLERKIMETVVHKGSPLTVGLEISSDEPAKLEGKDRLPDHFQLRSGDIHFKGSTGPGSSLGHSFTMLPEERGMFKMEPIELEVKESRSLFKTSLTLGPEKDIFVRASRKEIYLARLMSKRKQFEITGPAHRRHSRTYRADFRSVRDYMPGDRFRDIDWKAGARLTKLMTKEFEQETNMPTLIMVDASLSMREVVKRHSKMDHAIALALQISIVMDNHHHPVGLMTFDENKIIDHLSPGKQDIEEVLMTLFKLPNPVETGAYPGLPKGKIRSEDGSGDRAFLDSVGPFLVKGKRRTLSKDRATGIFEAVRSADLQEETGLLMVVISDLETNLPSTLKAVKLALGRKHRIIVISPFSWPYHLDRENLSPEELEKAYIDRKAKQEIIKGLRGVGVNVIEIEPGERGDAVLSGLRRMSQ
ncbi:MAG: DUF58 domain-containing protein, partial [Candidatus Thermoplasmatota archaeon]|nr:DUF58 domain-containing protein [Candidatus Thermoplasmatota archaeon]